LLASKKLPKSLTGNTCVKKVELAEWAGWLFGMLAAQAPQSRKHPPIAIPDHFLN
jgi:phenylpropionate dioxygenase-like ring-hydroxylating dioxygenase large terminal subunit